ncbi:hypothetical protein ACFY2M_42050 [Streptomyces sp. NPDC001276]
MVRGIGAWSVSVNSFLLAFLGAMGFRGLALAMTRPWTGGTRAREADSENGAAL